MNPDEKTCPICKQKKKDVEHYQNKRTGKYHPYCKSCLAAYNKKYISKYVKHFPLLRDITEPGDVIKVCGICGAKTPVNPLLKVDRCVRCGVELLITKCPGRTGSGKAGGIIIRANVVKKLDTFNKVVFEKVEA